MFNSYSGNIDLSNIKVVNNTDGTISTERSFSFSPDGTTEILVPAIVNGKELTQPDAIRHFFTTGENLGVFDTQQPGFSYEGLENYANGIHNTQDKRYSNQGLGSIQ